MGYSNAETYALFYRIRPTLRPPVEDENMTQNRGKRTSTRNAGAPLAGGHTRRKSTAEENLSAAHSALIASFELCRKGVPSEWKDRLSAQGLTVQPFKVSVEIANALINEPPETAAAEVLREYSEDLLDQFAKYIAKVAMKMLEENPNEEPAGEEQAIAAALLPYVALGEGHAIAAAPLPGEALGEEQLMVVPDGNRANTDCSDSSGGNGATLVLSDSSRSTRSTKASSNSRSASTDSSGGNGASAESSGSNSSASDSTGDDGVTGGSSESHSGRSCSNAPKGISQSHSSRSSSSAPKGISLSHSGRSSSSANKSISLSHSGHSSSSAHMRSSLSHSGRGTSSANKGISLSHSGHSSSSAHKRSSLSHSGHSSNGFHSSGASEISACNSSSASSSAHKTSRMCGQDQLLQLYSYLSQHLDSLPQALNSGGDEARANIGRDETSPRAVRRAMGEARNESNAQGSTITSFESGSRLASGHTNENAAEGSETFLCGANHPGMEQTNNQEVRQAEKKTVHSPRFTSPSTSTSNQHRSSQNFMGSGSRLQHSECGRVRDAPMPNLDDDIDSDENFQPPIMSGPALLARAEPLTAAPPQSTSRAAPGAQSTSTASLAGQV